MNSPVFNLPESFDFFPYARYRAEENMALDETLYQSVITGKRQAVFRIYGWDKPSITLGRFQSASGLDLKRCERDDIPVIRRITGGRGVFHHNEITYCMIIQREKPIVTDKKKAFSWISGIIARGLSHMGIEAYVTSRKLGELKNPNCFESTSLCEIVNKRGEKIVGSAMLVQSGTIMAQGSIPLDDTHKQLAAYLSERALPAKISDHRTIYYDSDYAAMQFAAGMENTLNLMLCDPTDKELSEVNSLVLNKYQSDSWNFMK